MSKSYFLINNGLLFPIQFQVLGYVLLFAGFSLMLIYSWVSIIFIFFGGLIVSAFSGIEFKDNQFREFNAFFFIKWGSWKAYSGVEKIFIKKIIISQKLYGRANQSSTFRNSVYKGFLKFEDGSKVLLLGDRNKSKLEHRLQKVAKFLQSEIVDYTN